MIFFKDKNTFVVSKVHRRAADLNRKLNEVNLAGSASGSLRGRVDMEESVVRPSAPTWILRKPWREELWHSLHGEAYLQREESRQQSRQGLILSRTLYTYKYFCWQVLLIAITYHLYMVSVYLSVVVWLEWANVEADGGSWWCRNTENGDAESQDKSIESSNRKNAH